MNFHRFDEQLETTFPVHGKEPFGRYCKMCYLIDSNTLS